MNDKYFENPNVFNPSRFINEEGKFVPSSKVFFFGLGKRRCPGEIFARAQVGYISTQKV